MTEETRARIRQTKAAKADAERSRAFQLSAATRDPEPSPQVQRKRTKAAGKRAQAERAAAILADKDASAGTKRNARNDQRRYATEARKLEMEADALWQEQREAHWRGHALAETASLAAGRGEAVEETETEVSDWLRGKHGALVRERGLPVLKTEKATTARRKSGLEWLRDKGRISEDQFRIGSRFAEVCSDAAKAAQPGKGGEGEGGRMSGQAPAVSDWRMAATALHLGARHYFASVLGQHQGSELFDLAENVCFKGWTLRDLAEGHDLETIRLEERLKVALAVLRVWFHLPAQIKLPPRHEREKSETT